MILNEPLPPDETRRTFIEALGQTDQAANLKFSLPVYAISVADLASERGEARAILAGWQFLAIDAKGPVAADVSIGPDDPSTDGPITASLRRGRAIEDILKAYEAVKKNAGRLKQTFELRRLRISGLRIEAFWLKMPPLDVTLEPEDWIYTFLAFQQQLKSKLLPARDFLSAVRELAAEQVGLDYSPRADVPRPSQGS